MRRNRRSSADDVLESVIDGALMGAGFAIANNIVGSMFNNDNIRNDSIDSDYSTAEEFGGGDFGGGGAGGEW